MFIQRMESMIRRRMMMGKKDDYLEGWLIGYRLNTVTIVASENNAVSPWFDVVGGHSIIYHNQGKNGNKGFWVRDSQGVERYLEWTSNDNTISLNDDVVAVRSTFYLPSIDDSYMLDQTTNTYLWKGKNVGGVVDYQPFSGYSAERSAA